MTKAISCWAVLGVAVLSACISPPTTRLCSTGIYCPEDKECGAVQAVCLDNPCGNGLVDSGEQCDDGNILPGDGCSPSCQIEKCGNGTLDPGEVCDDGNTKGGDGCSKDCLSLEKCGNGIVDRDAGEVCDDGNTNDGDGCNKTCTSTEVCGNGIVDTEVGEVCEPPGVGGCSADCRSTGKCGNGIIDPGEECDNGLTNNNDNADCRSDCVINRCGDGRPNTTGTHHEDCDGGPLTADHTRTAVPTETATCNIDCTTPACGDGKVNHSFTPAGATVPEQCDNGAGDNADNADCTAACQLNVCGDGHTNTVGPLHREGCDDGNRIDSDACTNACVAKACGDGIVGPGEECDLGSKNSDTGACLSSCLLAKCGDGKVEAGVEECDGTAGLQPCAANCRQQKCGNGIIDPGEECDNGAANNDSGDCRSDCILNRCGDGHVNTLGSHQEDCDAGPVAAPGSHNVTPTESATCNVNCATPSCGDGIINHKFVTIVGPPARVEQCDPPSALTLCSNACQFEHCGNGILDPGEECDGLIGLQPCSSTCLQERCGNGIVDPGEECDNGGANSDSGDCRSDCVINRCGDGHVNTLGTNKEDCDTAPVAGSGVRTVTPTESSTCNIDCTTSTCGDHKTNASAGEQCDNGTANNTDDNDCTAACKRNVCGDGRQDTKGLIKELCDDGPQNGEPCDYDNETCTRCNSTCTGLVSPGGPFCGDAVTNGPEVCDQGGFLNGALCEYGSLFCLSPVLSTICKADCTGFIPNPNGPFCGDAIVEAQFHEQCDPGGGLTPVDTTTCDSDCSVVACGDGHVNLAAGEVCDDGNASTCGTCSADCTTVTAGGDCGKGVGCMSDADCKSGKCIGAGPAMIGPPGACAP